MSEHTTLDRAVDEVCRKSTEFARLPAGEKAALLRQCVGSIVAATPAWVADACDAKGLDRDRIGEEWLAGPLPLVRMARLLGDSLAAISIRGKPPLGRGTRIGPGGRLAIDLLPASVFDRVLFAGFSGYALMQEGISHDDARRRQAGFYGLSDPGGRLTLILGAGNVSSIPPMDVLAKMFIDGDVCLLKMNPINDWLGPHLERALAPLIARSYLRIVYGGADVGRDLVNDDRIQHVHITGSDTTHDLIVWGPPGPGRNRRIADNDPLLKKPVTSELGNVSPVAVVPYRYSDDELEFQARNLTTMVTNNAGFNCNAAHVIITSARWSQRERFFDLIAQVLSRVPPRKAYYPGARERYERLTRGNERVEYYGNARDGELAWAIIRDVDATNRDNPLFQTEPFCGLVSETTLPSGDPVEFLASVTTFMNDTLWGTLNACIIVPPALERDRIVNAALDQAIIRLRYGTVAINHWPALCYGATTMPWGGHPGASLENIQSGLGWVHNTFMLDGVDKSVIRGPLNVRPTPVWFSDNPRSAALGPRLVTFESAPSFLKVPDLVRRSLF